jgi:hypothetical protein
MARPNPRDDEKDDGWTTILTGLFGEPTVKTTPPKVQQVDYWTQQPTTYTPTYTSPRNPRTTVTTTPPSYATPTQTIQTSSPTSPPQTGAVNNAWRAPTPSPTPAPSTSTSCYEVYGTKLQLNQQAVQWYLDHGVSVQPCQTTPTQTTTPANGELKQRVDYIESQQTEIRNLLFNYPQASGLASTRSDTDIWNHLNRYVWGKSGAESSPEGTWSADPNAIKPTLDRAVAEHGEFHTKLQNLGDMMTLSHDQALAHRMELEQKIEQQRTHTHRTGNGNGGDCNCGFWDIGCKWNCGWEKYGTVVMIIAGLIGLGILLWLLRPLFEIIGIFKSGGAP